MKCIRVNIKMSRAQLICCILSCLTFYCCKCSRKTGQPLTWISWFGIIKNNSYLYEMPDVYPSLWKHLHSRHPQSHRVSVRSTQVSEGMLRILFVFTTYCHLCHLLKSEKCTFVQKDGVWVEISKLSVIGSVNTPKHMLLLNTQYLIFTFLTLTPLRRIIKNTLW